MRSPEPKLVMFVANSSWNLANFRAPVIAALKAHGYRVAAAVPDDSGAEALRKAGVEVHPIEVDASGFSPVRDARLLFGYLRLFRRARPSAVFGFTVKPNIYASLAAARLKIPVVNTISGLGTGFLTGSLLEGLVSGLYRWSLARSARVFFHNAEDRHLFVARRLVTPSQAVVVAGSGVDLKRFEPVERRSADGPPTFLFIGRLLTDKGAIEFAEAAAIVRKMRSARFRMLGPLDDHPKAVSRQAIEPFAADGTVELLGQVEDVRPYIAEADCVVLPSYREGLPRALLEAAAMATPVIASDVPGCRHAVDDGETGLLCEARSAHSLAEAMTAFAAMPARERAAMGARAREKAQREFSEAVVVDFYLDSLRNIGL